MRHLFEHVLSVSEVSLIVTRPPGLRIVPYGLDAAVSQFGVMPPFPQRALEVFSRVAPSAERALNRIGSTMVGRVLGHRSGGVRATGFRMLHSWKRNRGGKD
jgi:hypothetical protein